MPKSPEAFRTISEVADWLGVQAHVLRFWESKFAQVKPVKRAGGRRYYRPADMRLLGGIRKLLHEEGMSIKDAQRLLREHGIAHVAALSPDLDTAESAAPVPRAADNVLSFANASERDNAPSPWQETALPQAAAGRNPEPAVPAAPAAPGQSARPGVLALLAGLQRLPPHARAEAAACAADLKALARRG